MNTGATYAHQQPKFNPLDFIPFIGDKSLSGMAIRGGLKGAQYLGNKLFGPKEDPWNDFTKGNPHLDTQKKIYDWGPTGGGDGQQQQYPPWWYDAYAQNILEDEELDIDTSTGDMEDWVQRFRVKDPYRQDRGALDEQIKEYISKLYT